MSEEEKNTTETEESGWKNSFLGHLRQKAHDAINDLHDRLVYTTKANKLGIKDAMGEDPNEPEVDKGFRKALKNDK